MKLSIIKIPSQDVSKLLHLYSDDDNDTFIKNRQTQITTGTIEIYAIKDHEEIIGEVTLVYNDPHKYFTLPQERVYMEALRILPEYQGRGI
jgi:ribosomal protein S18 acetylase RimI-like enzyme